MNPLTLSCFCFFSVLLYVYCVDPNVEIFLRLWLRKLDIQRRYFVYKVLLSPYSLWGRLYIRSVATRNAEANAKLLRKELGLPED